jgi:hypothetical protein
MQSACAVLFCHLGPVSAVECVWNVMAHTQKPEFVFRQNRRVHLNRQGRQFSRLLAAEVCASAVVMLNTPSSEIVCRVLATHSIRQFPHHSPSRASPCAITFHLGSTIFFTFSHELTNYLTPWNRVPFERLTGPQQVKKFPAFYGTWRFITTFTVARHLSLSWARSIQSMLPILLTEDPT